MVSPGRSGPAQALAPSASPAATPERAEEASRGASQDAVGVPDDATLLALATQTLEDYLRDGSPRVRRVAARALARAGSEAAINELVKQYDAETGAIARLDLAYALALAEHPKGKEVLAEALSADRRDTRFSAARYLAMLGDDRGRAQLKSALSLTTHRLSAAEAMSWLGDGEAIKVLKEALASKDVEPRMRAAEALAHVGDPAGAELLRTLIEDEHYALGAAEALAWLGDPAALPLLTRALSHSRICVDAALALRRMGHKADLASLATSLTSADEVGRVAAAEAVIVLLGPKVPVELEARKVKPLVAGAVLIKAPAKAAASGAAPGPEKSGAPAGAGAAAPAGAAPAAAAPAGAAEPSPPDGTAGAAAPTAADGAKVSPNAEGQPGGAAKMAPEPTEAHNR
jgi:HEAT repeat protein